MLRKSLIATLLVTASLPAWAFELKPGLWEHVLVTDVGTSQAPQEDTKQQCITEEDAKDPEAAFRRDFRAAGFTDIEFEQDGNTVNATAAHVSEAQNVKLQISSTKHSEEHTSATTEVTRNSVSYTTTQESRWIAEDC